MSYIQGTIFEVREFCLHDGPGIRTTVFFKGCPLHCAWCHNPEGLHAEPEYLTNGRLCGRRVNAQELANELRMLEPFLKNYGGGITFSGGEPLLQTDFLIACAENLRPLHLTLETSGYASATDYQRAVMSVDLVIQDIKHPDPAAHRRWTGGDLSVVVDNLRWLVNSGKPFIIRIPVVPTVNDTPEALAGFAVLLENAHHLQRVELLPYHATAGAKYHLVGKTYTREFEGKQSAHLDLTPFQQRNIPVVDYTTP